MGRKNATQTTTILHLITIHQANCIYNILPMPWAEKTLSNYLSDTIKQVVQGEVIDNLDVKKLYGKPLRC